MSQKPIIWRGIIQNILKYIRDICKVRKRQHQYPEFAHINGEIKKKSAKKYINIQGGVKLRKHPVFLFFPERLHCCYLDFHCSYWYSYYDSFRTLCIKCSAFCTEFQLTLRIPLKEELGGERRSKDRVTLQISLLWNLL